MISVSTTLDSGYRIKLATYHEQKIASPPRVVTSLYLLMLSYLDRRYGFITFLDCTFLASSVMEKFQTIRKVFQYSLLRLSQFQVIPRNMHSMHLKLVPEAHERLLSTEKRWKNAQFFFLMDNLNGVIRLRIVVSSYNLLNIMNI